MQNLCLKFTCALSCAFCFSTIRSPAISGSIPLVSLASYKELSNESAIFQNCSDRFTLIAYENTDSCKFYMRQLSINLKRNENGRQCMCTMRYPIFAHA